MSKWEISDVTALNKFKWNRSSKQAKNFETHKVIFLVLPLKDVKKEVSKSAAPRVRADLNSITQDPVWWWTLRWRQPDDEFFMFKSDYGSCMQTRIFSSCSIIYVYEIIY